MSQTLADRPAVSVDELKRAWAAVRAGQFRPHTPRPCVRESQQAGESSSWAGWPSGEPVLPVLGCGGSTGASTLAVALATAIGAPARVVECASPATSGLAAASTAELGRDGPWVRGTRGQVLLEHVADVLTILDEVPAPLPAAGEVTATVLDVGWQLGQALAGPGWVQTVVQAADPVVLATTATVPGLRRLEVALDLLAGTPAVAAVLGPPRKRWAKAVRHGAGDLTQRIEDDGRLVVVPLDTALGVHGLTGSPLPQPLLSAAAQLLRLTPGLTTKGTP